MVWLDGVVRWVLSAKCWLLLFSGVGVFGRCGGWAWCGGFDLCVMGRMKT